LPQTQPPLTHQTTHSAWLQADDLVGSKDPLLPEQFGGLSENGAHPTRKLAAPIINHGLWLADSPR